MIRNSCQQGKRACSPPVNSCIYQQRPGLHPSLLEPSKPQQAPASRSPAQRAVSGTVGRQLPARSLALKMAATQPPPGVVWPLWILLFIGWVLLLS